MSKYIYWLLVMVTLFSGMFAYFVGDHLSCLEKIEYQITMNALALDRCSNALAALVVSKVSPIKCKLGEFHYKDTPQITNNFIHSVRFEEVQK